MGTAYTHTAVQCSIYSQSSRASVSFYGIIVTSTLILLLILPLNVQTADSSDSHSLLTTTTVRLVHVLLLSQGILPVKKIYPRFFFARHFGQHFQVKNL